MKLVSSMFEGDVVVDEGDTIVLVIENRDLFREYVRELIVGVNGEDTQIVLSENNRIIKLSSNIEIISSIIPFDINSKKLLGKIAKIMEQEALNEDNYANTQALLSEVEKYLYELSFVLPCDIYPSTLSVQALVKMAGVRIQDDSETDIERMINYMSLVRDLVGNQLFVYINVMTYFGKADLEMFVDMVKRKGMRCLLIEASEYDKIEGVKRVIIDEDLCRI